MARDTAHVQGLDQLLDRLKALPPEVVSKRGGPVRTAVRRAAMLIVREAQQNVRQITDAPNVGGGDNSTGLLEKSVKAMRGRPNRSGLKGETVIVTVPRRARYPVDKRTPTGVGVATIGRMLEYGTAKRRPYPWMGPAFHSKKAQAVEAMRDELLKGIERIERKLGSGR